MEAQPLQWHVCMQKFQKQKGGALILINVAIIVCHVLAAVAFMKTLQAAQQLPSTLRAPYKIYNAADTAVARPLLPYKANAERLVVTEENVSNYSSLLECGTRSVDDSTEAPTEVPRWALPTNNTGINALYENQVARPSLALASLNIAPLGSAFVVERWWNWHRNSWASSV
jgi:hypothetical protein